MKNRRFLYISLIVVSALLLSFFNLPGDTQKKIFPYTPQAIVDSKFELGLDLQGGSQLDYNIDLRKVPANEQKNIINGVLEVINKRVNSLGVSEPNIYISNPAGETHLIVELAGIKDLEKAKEIVGKTIQLEFKEQRTEPDPNAAEKVKQQAQTLLDKIKKGSDIKVLGEEEQQANSGKVAFEEVDFKYKDEVPPGLAEKLFALKPGEVSDLIESSAEYTLGNIVPLTGYNIIKVLDKRDQEREIEHKREVKVHHILISFKGAEKADANVTRNEEEAKKLAEEILQKLKNGEKFEDLAKQYTDDPTGKETGGDLPEAVTGDDNNVKDFQDAALALQKPGDLSQAVKTVFGYHIIKADSIKEASTEKKIETQVKYARIFFNSAPDQWQETELNGQHFVHADVVFNQAYQPYVSIKFNGEGAKLFEQITERNVGKPVAIFVGGDLISAPNVNEKISGGEAQISGSFTLDQANNLARDLNTGAIPAPITLAGQYTIGASLGQDALNKSLYAGVIGFLLVIAFMVLYYRLPGFLAAIALTVYSALLLFLIKAALPLYLALLIAIGVFTYLIFQILKAKDSGPEKFISVILSCFILFFLSFILSTSVVMTLAGIAGVVLSIGMAVDANILIFERIKEELREGRPLNSAIEVGFERAWSSIRDSNFSSLITCGILFYFGSSIIQGFAFNLAAGILVSMFTAITVSKTLLQATANTALGKSLWLFGGSGKKEKKLLPIIQTRKISYVISAILLIAALVGIPAMGVKWGLDFTGGTLMELKFKNNISIEQLKTSLENSAKNVNSQLSKTSPSAPPVTPEKPEETTLTGVTEQVDLGSPVIVSSNDGYIIKTRHISAVAHDLLLPELKKQLGDFEEIRFNTVGPTVGESLRYKAVIAVIIASIMIVIYIAFAFRKVPRQVSKWKFGAGAVIALLHDLGIMLGVYVYLGALFGVEIDALFITALLTILGFSVHDTIVVFDRIREKLKLQKRGETFSDIANHAINETIGRSINTSFSVLLTLIALAAFGSENIRFFIISLIVGVVAGTYSSIFVATPILVDWHGGQNQKTEKNAKTAKARA